MARGYMILAGKSDEPVKDLLWRLSLYGIILMFASNASGWFTLVTDAINDIGTWAQGDVSLYKQLDDMMVDIIKMGGMMEDQDGTFEFTGFFAQILVNMSFVIFSIPAIVIIITAEFVLKILIMIGPIMILVLIFDSLKTIFDNWLKMILSSVLTLLFVGIFFKIIALKYEAMVKQSLVFAQGGDIGIISIAMDVFIVSLVVVVLILMARGIAQQLTYVSINSLPGSSSKEGLTAHGVNGKSAFRKNKK
jgi:type IV secretion system protein VirB6